MTIKNLSIIIPVGPDEDQLSALLDDLRILPAETEIILVSCSEIKDQSLITDRLKLITSPQGRACQQNVGARVAARDFLWFLHADSRVTSAVITALEMSLAEAPEALHYFHLKFNRDGPGFMWLNEWGARFRSQILGMPFGDQGFCLRRNIFEQIGGFPEQAPYGEDHLLVWSARQAGFKLKCTGMSLQTSARKYRQQGWGALTLKYQYLWIKQALPEFYKLILYK